VCANPGDRRIFSALTALEISMSAASLPSFRCTLSTGRTLVGQMADAVVELKRQGLAVCPSKISLLRNTSPIERTLLKMGT
jgi:hypothetical protein